MRKKGFTLVELLVVISIIALLMSILMPALSKTRETAKTLVCEAGMKQLITAWHTLAVDNDDVMVVSYEYRDDNDPVTMVETEWVWAPTEVDTGRTVTGGQKPTLQERQEGVKRGSLYPYASDVSLFHCPSDKSEYKHFRSYSIPDCMNGIMKYTTGTYHKWDTLTRVLQIKRPTEKYVFIEENEIRDYNMGSWMPFFDTDTFGGDPMGVWHLGKSSLAFADGHCEQRKWSKEFYDYFIDFNQWQTKQITTVEGRKDLEWLKNGWAKP